MQWLVDHFSEILDFGLNLLELIAIVVSVFTFFFLMLNKYSKALKKILGACGLSFWSRMRVLFICRKSQNKKRAFVEYAILQTGGYSVSSSEWNAIINGFKTFYNESDLDRLVYPISNCTTLIDPKISQAIEKYFNYFSNSKVKKVFGIQEEMVEWVLKVRIEEAYATPTCLLTGLLSQYDENWEEFIRRYVSTAYITEAKESSVSSVSTNELYFTFAWLLWGPSYELEYRKYWAGLCQLSYGDESNSIPAIADTETNIADRLRRKFEENDERRYGALIAADVRICEKNKFYEELRANINPDNAYFYNKVEHGDLSFGVKIINFSPMQNYKAKKYYSTAYVWILFELEDSEYTFKPEKSVAFFEHANLANKETYKFLVDTLIDKSLKHFREVFSSPKFAERKYRFVCAMNDKIANACIERFRMEMQMNTEFGNKLRNNIYLTPKHSPADVFAAYDEFFTPSKQLHYVVVDLNNPKTIVDLGQFYTRVYIEAFPDEDEREKFDNFLKYLKRAENSTDYEYHIVLAKDGEGNVIAGAVFNYFKKPNSGVIEFLAVRSDVQSGGVGTQLYKHVVLMLSADAHKHRGRGVDYIFCEIDSPEYSRSEIKKYLYFWQKNKYWHLKFNYVQPALSIEQEPVRGLWFTVSPQNAVLGSVNSQIILDVLYAYTHYAMDIDNPESNEQFIEMKKELTTHPRVEIEKIIK